MRDPCVRLLQDLVAINSVNPLLVEGAPGEAEIAERIVKELRGAGVDAEVEAVDSGRPNVVGVVEGRTKGRSLVLCGHMDTVGVEGMENPFDPEIRGDKLYGRGSQDMKGGLAAIIDAACGIARSGGLSAGRLIIAAVMDEEYTSLGAQHFVEKWTADAGIVCEPTDLTIGMAHKGFEWAEVTVRGIAAHGSRPHEGRDAILFMGRVLSRLALLDQALQERQPYPMVGVPSVHASTIRGGRELSVYPDSCVLRLERRTIPGEANGVSVSEMEQIIGSLSAEDSEFRAEVRSLLRRPAYELSQNSPLPAILRELLEGKGRKAQLSGTTFWTDAAVLGEAGIPSMIFGPGGGGLHSSVEYVNLDEVLMCRDVLDEFVRKYLEKI